MVSTCPRRGTVSVWQVYITWSALTWRRGWFQYNRCTLVSTHPEKRLVSVWQVYITLTTFTHRREEGDSSMTGVHYTVSTDPQKSRKGLFQYDRCTLHSQCTPREEEVKLVSAWQVYTTWSALTQRRGQFQYDWCTLHGQQSPKEDDGFSMTGVSHTVSAHQEKRRKGWFQDGRCTLHGQHSPSEKAGFSMTGVKLHGQGTPREEKRLVSIWQVYTAQFSTHPAKRPGASDCNVCMPCWICMMASRARGLLTVACTSGLLSCPTTDNYYYQHNTKYKNALTKNSCLLTSKHKLDFKCVNYLYQQNRNTKTNSKCSGYNVVYTDIDVYTRHCMCEASIPLLYCVNFLPDAAIGFAVQYSPRTLQQTYSYTVFKLHCHSAINR